MTQLDHTHDAQARSWLQAANQPGADFPIQNLPFGVIRRRGSTESFRGGVAIGDQVIDMAALAAGPALQAQPALARQAAQACTQPVLNDFFALGPEAWRALRHALFDILKQGASQDVTEAVRSALIPQAQIEHAVPARIGDYTDFYTSYFHADNFGRIMREVPTTEEVVSPNFHWIPLAYHGRASSIGVSGQKVRRPVGQSRMSGTGTPRFGPCEWMDYEMELGFYVGTGNELGTSVPLSRAESH
nr:fumarylacetoacetate hydrolase family protein [Pseudomonas sp.]